MSVGLRVYGPQKRGSLTSDVALLNFAKNCEVDGKSISFIQLKLNKGMVVKKMPFRVFDFQSYEAQIDTNTNDVKTFLTKDHDGKDTFKYPTPFNFDLDNFGLRTAYVADTPFNRAILADQLHYGACYSMVESDVKKEITKVGDAKQNREKLAKQKALEKATETIHGSKADLLAALIEKYPKGAHLQVEEYIRSIGSPINKLTLSIFKESNDWRIDPAILKQQKEEAAK